MTLPGFLVLGAQRAGTTWLDRHLRAHRDVYLPERRKELHIDLVAFPFGLGFF